MEKHCTFAANTAGKSFCPRPPALSRTASLDAAVDKGWRKKIVIFSLSRVAVRVIRTDEERMIAKTVCRVLGLGSRKEN
jgi:acetate kinase